MRVHVRGGAGEAGGSLSLLYLSFPPVSSLSSAVLGAGGGERKYVSARGRCVPSLRGGGGERATAAHGWCALAPAVSDGCLAPGRRTTAQFRGGDDECKGGNRKHQVGGHGRLFVAFQRLSGLFLLSFVKKTPYEEYTWLRSPCGSHQVSPAWN